MSLVFKEEKEKVKSSAIKTAIVAAVSIMVGFMTLHAQRRIGYMGAAFGGALLGGGIGGAAPMLYQLYKKLQREPFAVISADETGVEIATGQTTVHKLSWQEIKSITPRKRGIQKGVIFDLVDTEAFLQRLDPKEQKFIKQNGKFFRALVPVSTSSCAATNEEIATQLTAFMQKAKG